MAEVKCWEVEEFYMTEILLDTLEQILVCGPLFLPVG